MLSSLSLVCLFLFILGVPYWLGGGSVVLLWGVKMSSPFSFFFSFMLDPMGLGFGFVLSLVASAVYTYSLGYMGAERGLSYFYGPLSIFVGSMLVLIFVPDYVCFLLAWDGLGVSSFLLVLFYENSQSAGASMLTVLTNRFGDACFLMGCCGMVIDFNFLMFSGSSGFSSFMFLMAGFSKSAQWPLSAWLPAAMAAPTPISSLVHSSTLVTAGVFLVIRSESFSGSEFDSMIWVPCLTLIISCVSACLSFDLKRVIAMSTLSHLSLMFLSLFLGYSALAYFHLLTHALFKSLLFMSAGNAISYFYGSQDIRDMGGMFKALPVSSQSMFISVLSLMGFPFTSGFYSKDLILEASVVCLQGGNFLVGAMAVFSVPMSVYYPARLCFFLFFSGPVYPMQHGVESNFCSVSSLISLSVFSIIFGCLLDSFFCPFDFLLSFSWYFLFFWGGLGAVAMAIFFSNEVDKKGEDYHGGVSLCYLRVPYQVISFSVLEGSLLYIQQVEHGWLEYLGPRGASELMKALCVRLSWFEW